MLITTAVVTKSHKDDSNDDGDFRHACTIAVFLLIRLFYIFIHSLNYLFKSIQTFIMLANLINFVVIFSLIAYYLLNLFLKLILSH